MHAHKSPVPGIPALISYKQTCETLDISRPTLCNLIALGELDSVKIGRSRKIRTDSLQRLIDEGVEVITTRTGQTAEEAHDAARARAAHASSQRGHKGSET